MHSADFKCDHDVLCATIVLCRECSEEFMDLNINIFPHVPGAWGGSLMFLTSGTAIALSKPEDLGLLLLEKLVENLMAFVLLHLI